jgi:hypothetical protein
MGILVPGWSLLVSDHDLSKTSTGYQYSHEYSAATTLRRIGYLIPYVAHLLWCIQVAELLWLLVCMLICSYGLPHQQYGCFTRVFV